MNSSTKNKYYRVRRDPEDEEEQAQENEIRITGAGTASRYIGRAGILFLEKKLDTIILKAAGKAISTLCVASEIIRRRIPDLHQISQLKNTEIIDKFEPKEEGLDPVIINRKLSVLEIKLTRITPTTEELNDAGYQAPLPSSEVEEMTLDKIQSNFRGGRGRGGYSDRRGGRGFRRGDRGGGYGGGYSGGYGGGYGGYRGERRGFRSRGGRFSPDIRSRGGRGFRRGGYNRDYNDRSRDYHDSRDHYHEEYQKDYHDYEEDQYDERPQRSRGGRRGGDRRGGPDRGRGRGFRGYRDDSAGRRPQRGGYGRRDYEDYDDYEPRHYEPRHDDYEPRHDNYKPRGGNRGGDRGGDRGDRRGGRRFDRGRGSRY